METSRKKVDEGSSEIRGLKREREGLPSDLEKRNEVDELLESQQAFMLALTESVVKKSRELELAFVQILPQRKRATGKCGETPTGLTEFQDKTDEPLKFDIRGLKREHERLPSELEKLKELDGVLENQQAFMIALTQSILKKSRELRLARIQIRPQKKRAMGECEENPTGLNDQLVKFDGLCSWLHMVMASNMGTEKVEKLLSKLEAEELKYGKSDRLAGPEHVLLAAHLHTMGFSMEEWDVSLLCKDRVNPIPQEDQDVVAAGAKTLQSHWSLSKKQIDLFNHIKSFMSDWQDL